MYHRLVTPSHKKAVPRSDQGAYVGGRRNNPTLSLCPPVTRLSWTEQVDGAMNSLGVFLGQEAVRFNGLVAVMRATLSELQKAIRCHNLFEPNENCLVSSVLPRVVVRMRESVYR